MDVQNDFIDGSLPAADAKALPAAIAEFRRGPARHWPAAFTRDWHPADHCSFQSQGGPWPPHCVAGTTGAALAEELGPFPSSRIVDKGRQRDRPGYSGFDEPALEEMVRREGANRIVVVGLTTEYCVSATVLDALRLQFHVTVLRDLIRPVRPADEPLHLDRLAAAGATVVSSSTISHGLDGAVE